MRMGYIYNVIYKSRCLYVGSTWNFKKRMDSHLSDCYNPNIKRYNKNLYKFIRATDVWEAFRFTIIDTIETDDSEEDRGKNEKDTAEQFYIDMLEPTLNGPDAIISPEERRKRQAVAQIKLEQRIRDSKLFACEPCGYNGASQSKLDKHYKTNKHKNINN